MTVLSALTQNQIQGMALFCYENERPLKGLIGELDWKLNGVFTRLVRAGTLTGQRNEVSYVPVKWNDQTFHFLVLGNGTNPEPGKRTQPNETQVALVRKKSEALGLTQIAIEGMNKGGTDGQ